MRAKSARTRQVRRRRTVAGWRDALRSMLLTELTFHADRSELKEEAPKNTAREESVRAKADALGKPMGGWAKRRICMHWLYNVEDMHLSESTSSAVLF